MTLQSCPNSSEEVAPSPSCSTSTSSTDVYPLPYSIGDKEIVLNNDERSVVSVVTDNEFLGRGTTTNISVENSTNVDVGNRTVFNGDVTIYQHINGHLPEIQNGPIEHGVDCNKNGQVVGSSDKSIARKEYPKNLKTLLKQRPTQLGIAGFLLILMAVASLAVYFAIDLSFNKPNPVPPTFGHDDDLGDGIQVIHRKEWLARDPLNVTKIAHPLKMVRIMHTGGSNCKDYQTCANKVLAMQGWQVGTKGMPDLSYNYMIGGDGNVYIGRGADVENEWRPDAIDIGYIGNFLTPYDQMTDKMEEAGKRLISRLREKGKITPDYIVVAQNQTYNTQSPGQNIFKKIVKWPHYDPGLYFN